MFFNKSLFKAGDRVRVVLPQINLDHGAGDEYPQMGTGTIGVPTKKVMVPVTNVKDEKPGFEIVARQVIEPDLQKLTALRDERQAWIQLDWPFPRAGREETIWRKKEKPRVMRDLAIPEGLLQSLKPEDDPGVVQA